VAAPKGAVEADWSQVTRFNARLVKELDQASTNEGFRAASEAASAARAAAPKRSGRFAGSIQAQPVGGGDQGGLLTFGAGVPYAAWIEFGGRRPHFRPYIRTGRYVFPAAAAAGTGFKTRMIKAATTETRKSR